MEVTWHPFCEFIFDPQNLPGSNCSFTSLVRERLFLSMAVSIVPAESNKTKWSIGHMEAYEIYWRDENGEAKFIGILPERRRNPERITQRSIMNWGRKVIDDDAEVKDIFFTKVRLEENIGERFLPRFSVRSKETLRK
jgi:hypothetical protein